MRGEDVADADADAGEGDDGDAGPEGLRSGDGCMRIQSFLVRSARVDVGGTSASGGSVQMHRVVQVDAGQDGEHIGLQAATSSSKPISTTLTASGRCRSAGPDRAGAGQDQDEGREHLEHDVAGDHVGEQTDREADRPREVGDHLDRDDQRRQQLRRALREEVAEEVQPVDRAARRRSRP